MLGNLEIAVWGKGTRQWKATNLGANYLGLPKAATMYVAAALGVLCVFVVCCDVYVGATEQSEGPRGGVIGIRVVPPRPADCPSGSV